MKSHHEVTEEFLKFADLPNPEEYVIRTAIIDLVGKLPMSELESIFKITVHTGRDPIDSSMPDWYIMMILDLQSLNKRRYEIEYVGNKEQNDFRLLERSNLQQDCLEESIRK